METLTHPESRRLYSWWWDSHISPKNSKWLHENLTDMDVKVKTMIKLIEEDADSFARRAEMYYKKRPELMKLVEELYRAYRALAERYDHATGELRQAQRTMAEAFPNQMPFILPDDTPPGSSMTDTEPHTPEMPRPIRALFDQDDLQTETLDVSSDFHAIKRNGVFPEGNDTLASKKGLKQLNEMFNENILPEYGESKVRKGLNFQVEEGKGPDFKARNGTGVPHKHELEGQERGTQYEELDLEERGDGDNESSSLQEDEVSQLLIENENLKMQLLSESERSAKAEKEVYDLREVLSKLKDEKEAALLQYQQCLDRYNNASERIAGLKMEVSLAQEEARGLNDEILKGVAKWRGFEERSIMLERENQNLQIEMDGLVHRLMTQQEEMKEKHDELEKLRICIQEERLNCARMDAALQNFQQLHARSQEEQRVLMVELQNGVQFLKEMESKKHDLEEEIIRIREENNCLNEQNMSSVISIKNSQDELCSLMEKNQKLEEEVGFRVDQRNALQQELYCLKEEINDFERRYRGVIVQIESVGFNPESLQASVRALWNENSNLKDTCQRNSEEKQVLLERLRNMDKLSEKNNFLENSLSDMSIEIDDLRGKVKCFEKSCRSLEEDKTTLITENGSLLLQVESVMKGLCDMESVHLELQDRHSGLKTEKELMVNEVKEIHDSLELQKCEHENLIKSSNVQIATLRDQIDLLQEECRLRKLELEEQEDKSMNSQLELYVLRLCIHDMKEMYDAILIECRKHIKESAAAGKLVSELEQKNLRQEAKFKSLVSEHSLTALINQKLLMGIQELLQVLNMVDNRYSDIKDEVFVQNILGKVKALQVYILYEQDEKQRLVFENLMNATFLEQMRCGILDLIAEKEAIETESLRRKNELLLLESEKHELAEMNSQLRQEVVGVMSREEMLKTEMGFVKKQLSDLEESDQALTIENHKLFEENQSMKKVVCDVKEEKCMLEEENDAILGEALKLVNLGSIFEGFSVEKALELQRVNGDLDDFRIIKSNLEKEISAMMAKMEILEIERLKLKESIQELEEDRTHAVILLEELNSVRDVCQNLNCEISIGKNLLSEKEIELVIAGENLEAEQKEKAKLTRDLESIKRESDEVWEIRKSLEKQISVLSEEKIDLQNEITSIRTEKVGLEFELDKLSKEIDGFRVREENLNSELGNWEAENTAVLVDLQSSLINATMFKEKVYELIEACESLEKNARIWERNVNSELSFWEAEAGSSFVELQTSSIRAALLEEKVCELIGAYDNLKEDSQMEREKFCETRKNLVMQNFVLSEQKIDLEKEITSVHEEKVGLEFELDKLSKEINRFRIREENLNSELGNWEADTAKILVDLQLSSIREALLEEKVCKLIEACENLEENALVWERKVNSELGVFEAEAAASFVELQTSHIRAVLLEGKVCELIGACDNLEENTHMEREKFLNEIALRNMDIDELKGKIALLEEENGLMKAESAMYLPPVLSLRDSLSSLEECSLSLTKAHGNGVLELQGSVTMCHQNNTTSTHELSEGQVSKIPDGVLELQKLQSKVQAVEKVLMELARLDQPIEDENVGKNQENSNLGTATGETEELELQSSVVQEEDQTSKGIIIEQDHEIGELGNDLEPEKIESGITKVKHGPLTKDIQLDHVSDTSCYEKSVSKNLESEDQMLELWETAEQDCGRKPIPNKDIEYHQPEVVEELKSENPSSELQAEKELRVDNVAGLTRVAGSHHKRTMSRLSSNARRLKNLQLTAQELNNKCEGSKRSNQPTGYEYENVKAQLKEVEETILAYVDVNAQLIKNAEDGSSETGVGTEKNKEGSENVQKQQGPELARKGSLNIGKLELEVQRIQFLVHKLEEERSFKGDVGGERRTRILLRDYIYSYVGREKGRKKGKFCACMRPSTSSD